MKKIMITFLLCLVAGHTQVFCMSNNNPALCYLFVSTLTTTAGVLESQHLQKDKPASIGREEKKYLREQLRFACQSRDNFNKSKKTDKHYSSRPSKNYGYKQSLCTHR